MLVTKPLQDALTHLEITFGLIHSSLARAEPALAPVFRTAAIKSYEYVYELAIRLIRRALELKAASPSEIDPMDFKTLMRTAAEKGLIDDPLAWTLFRAKRNITAHTYDEARAADVLAVVPQLLERTRFLLARLSASDVSG